MQLTKMFSRLHCSVRVEPFALSNQEDEAQLRILTQDLGRSTIEDANPLADPDRSPTTVLRVQRRTLDSYKLDAVGFMKIDVEGHEFSVLEGASNTIRRCKPNMVIEIEERHKPGSVRDVKLFLEDLEYRGFFLKGAALLSLDDFDKIQYQNPANIGSWKTESQRFGTYINNFIFVHLSEVSKLKRAFEHVVASGLIRKKEG
jgi:FkbM family methyltransferase